MFEVMEKMRQANVTDAELADAKRRVAGGMVMQMQTIGQQADRRLEGILNGYPADYTTSTRRRSVGGDGRSDQSAMEKYVDPKIMQIVVVAPAEQSREKLGALGEVKVEPMPGKAAREENKASQRLGMPVSERPLPLIGGSSHRCGRGGARGREGRAFRRTRWRRRGEFKGFGGVLRALAGHGSFTEEQCRAAKDDLVAFVKEVLGDLVVTDPGAVAAIEVGEQPAVGGRFDAAVAAGNGGVAAHEIAGILHPPNGDRAEQLDARDFTSVFEDNNIGHAKKLLAATIHTIPAERGLA